MLFQKNILRKYLALLPAEQIAEAWSTFRSYFLNAAIQQNILQSKEEQFQEGFLRELFVKVLGYTLNPSPNFNLIILQENGFTDLAKPGGQRMEACQRGQLLLLAP